MNDTPDLNMYSPQVNASIEVCTKEENDSILIGRTDLWIYST